MGAGQSKVDHEEQVILNETPIQFSQDVVDHLADVADAPGPSSERQSSIDAQIRSRIHAELLRLQQEEQEVRREIELTMEKENLDHEAKAVEQSGEDIDEGKSSGDSHTIFNSTVMLGDLEEVRHRIEKFRLKQEHVDQPSAGDAAHTVSFCYRNNLSTPLECWREVSVFRTYVAQMEQDYIVSFR